jgi:hypothetical protein
MAILKYGVGVNTNKKNKLSIFMIKIFLSQMV